MDKQSRLKSNLPEILKAENVSKIYKVGEVEFAALQNINLTIYAGDFISIVGPSGSGKSTLMYILGLLDRPTNGVVFVENQKIENLSEDELANLRNQKVGFVFQTFNLLARTSTLENVILPLQYSKIPIANQKEKGREMLKKVGLGTKERNFPSQLSGGEAQRVAIARALICDPAIILADEPTGNLDSITGSQILALFKSLNAEGKTIVIVTHDREIAKHSKRIIHLADGQIIN